MFLADQKAHLLETAMGHYKDAIAEGRDPANWGCDYTLVELDLAEHVNVDDFDPGVPTVVYLMPEE